MLVHPPAIATHALGEVLSGFLEGAMGVGALALGAHGQVPAGLEIDVTGEMRAVAVEGHVGRGRCPGRAGGPAVDARGADGGVEDTVEAAVARLDGRVAAVELLMVSYGARQHIRKNALQHLHQEMSLTRRQGSLTLEDSLARLVRGGLITAADALVRAGHPDALESLLKSSS